LKRRVSERDRAYIDELLIDLHDRSRITPEQVFEQLSNLSVGPIVTDGVEWVDRMDASAARITELHPDFCLYANPS